jgi:hypothetical protein
MFSGKWENIVTREVVERGTKPDPLNVHKSVASLLRVAKEPQQWAGGDTFRSIC